MSERFPEDPDYATLAEAGEELADGELGERLFGQRPSSIEDAIREIRRLCNYVIEEWEKQKTTQDAKELVKHGCHPDAEN